MRRALLVLVAIVGCEKTASKPSPSPDPWDKPVEVGSGSGSVVPVADEQLIGDMMEYTVRAAAVLLAFDGDCSAQATRLLTLEPLAKSLRTRLTPFATSRAAEAAFKAQLKPYEAEMTEKLDRQLASLHATEADLKRKEADAKQKCGSDPQFKDAMDRTGVFRKKQP